MSELVLWTRVECLCGRAAAIPEGGHFPLCGACGRRMVPPGPDKAICYVSPPMSSSEAEALLEPPALVPEGMTLDALARRYDDDDLRERLARHGFSDAAQDWPLCTAAGGYVYSVPPWEAAR